MTKRRAICLVTAVAVAICVICACFIGCTPKEEALKLLKAEEIEYLDEIQGKDNLYFEWLRPFNAAKPTMILIHGETTGAGDEKFTMKLDENEYAFKTETNGTEYVVADKIGFKASGLNLDLSHYWLSTANYNVAIFHWERFADDNSDDLLAKLFSVPKMRYLIGDGQYETGRVPRHSLTEIFAALYVNEMSDKLTGREIRFVGNGVGADLALSAAHYLSLFADKGELNKSYLPNRLALCDPYFSIDDMHLSGDKLPWADISTTDGMMGVAESMVSKVAAYGAAVEMTESVEIGKKQTETESGTTDITTYTYAYDLEKSEVAEQKFNNIKKNLAYLELRESYSNKFSADYKALKRIALDWYLYSIIGSDDSGNAGASYAVGYPRELSNFTTYLSYSGFNWAPNETRPMVNNRQLNSDSSANSSRGKNYSLSAWTPTVYTRALRGVSFKMKKYRASTTITTVHGNQTFTYDDYTMGYFRSESFQVSDQTNYTLVCGYVYLDKNGDKFINDGYSGIPNVELSVSLTTGSGDTLKTVNEFTVRTDDTGFYAIRLEDKTRDSEGNLSSSGYSFSETTTCTINLIPSSHDYVSVSSAASGPFYTTVGGHNFSGYKATVTLNLYNADAISVANCLVKPASDK